MNTEYHQLIQSEGYLTSCFLFTDRLQLFAFPFLSIFPECEIFANIGGEIALILYWNPYQPKLQSLSKSNYVTFVFESDLTAIGENEKPIFFDISSSNNEQNNSNPKTNIDPGQNQQ